MNPKQELLQILFENHVFTGSDSELGRILGYMKDGRTTIGRIKTGERNLTEKTLDELCGKLQEEYLTNIDDMAIIAESITYAKDLYHQLREAYGTGSDWHDTAFSAIVTENYQALPGMDEAVVIGLKEIKLQEPEVYYGMLSFFYIMCKDISPYTNKGKKALCKQLPALNNLLAESFPGCTRAYESSKKTIEVTLDDESPTILKLIYNFRIIIRWYADDTYFENFIREMGHLLDVGDDSFWIVPGETFHAGCEMWYMSVIPTKSHKRGTYTAMKLRAKSASTDSFELTQAYHFMFLIDGDYDNIHILQASYLPSGKTEYAQYCYNGDSRLLELNFDDVPEKTFNLPQVLECINHTAPRTKDEKVWARIIEKFLDDRSGQILLQAINSSADSNIEYLTGYEVTNVCIDRQEVIVSFESEANGSEQYCIDINAHPFLKKLTVFEFASVVRYKDTKELAICWNNLGQFIPIKEFTKIETTAHA